MNKRKFNPYSAKLPPKSRSWIDPEVRETLKRRIRATRRLSRLQALQESAHRAAADSSASKYGQPLSDRLRLQIDRINEHVAKSRGLEVPGAPETFVEPLVVPLDDHLDELLDE